MAIFENPSITISDADPRNGRNILLSANADLWAFTQDREIDLGNNFSGNAPATLTTERRGTGSIRHQLRIGEHGTDHYLYIETRTNMAGNEGRTDYRIIGNMPQVGQIDIRYSNFNQNDNFWVSIHGQELRVEAPDSLPDVVGDTAKTAVRSVYNLAFHLIAELSEELALMEKKALIQDLVANGQLDQVPAVLEATHTRGALIPTAVTERC